MRFYVSIRIESLRISKSPIGLSDESMTLVESFFFVTNDTFSVCNWFYLELGVMFNILTYFIRYNLFTALLE